MKRFLVLLAVILGSVAAAWVAAQMNASSRRKADEEKALRYAPAPGRIEFVSLESLFSDPAKYDRKRLILTGVWSTGFECSFLDLDNSSEDFGTWVEFDWDKVDGPMGDFSTRKKVAEEQSDVINHTSLRIIAEGTFFYREKSGFGHLGVSKKLFIIDRLYQCEPIIEKDTKKQPTEPGPVASRL